MARSDAAPWRRTFDAVLVAATDDEVTVLEGPARIMWELLDEPMPWSRAVERLAAVHGTTTTAIGQEVEAVGDDLLRRRVLQLDANPEPAQAVPPADAARALDGDDIVEHPAAALAAWGLRPGPTFGAPDDWEPLLEAIRRERLSGLVFGAVTAGDLDLTPDQVGDVGVLHRAAMTTAVRTERLLHATLATLEGAGIAAVVHKGPAIAHGAYADPAHRPFGDIDLVVPPAQLDETFRVLTATGHERRFSEPRPGFDRRFGKGAAFVTADGLEIDVHRTFASGPFGLTVDLDEVHATARSTTIDGRAVRVLGDAQQVVAVASHAALGTRWPRLLNLRDVVQLVTAPGLDADDVIDVAGRWRVDAALARAVRAAVETFCLDDGGHELFGWAARHRASRRQQRALEAYTASTRGYSRQALAALPVIPGIRSKAAYLRAMLLPDRDYEADRHESLPERWRRIARTAVHR